MAETVVGAFEKLLQHMIELVDLPAEAGLGEMPELVGTMQACRNVCDELHRRVALAAGRSDAWALDGFRSPARWIAFHAGIAHSLAAKVHREARELAELPHASAAASVGLLNQVHVEQMVRCCRRAPERYDAVIDETFTAVATSGDLTAFAAAVRAWNERVDAELEADPAPEPPSEFTLAETLDGWGHGTLNLNPHDTAIVNAALERRVNNLMRRKRDGDPSLEHHTIPTLRAHALVDLCDADLRRDPGERRQPDRHRTIIVLHHNNDGTLTPEQPIPPGGTCDSDVTRIVLGADSEVLDIGRAQRTWPTPIANAIIFRDRHCVFPGCDAPPGHSDIHHCQPWENGGPTAVTNGALLCRGHHTFLHGKHWTITLNDHQQPIIHKPDGTKHTLHPERPQRE